MFLLSLALASLLRHPPLPDRRAALVGAAGAVLLPRRACARAPGSEDVDEALAQIRDAAVALKSLRRDWASYALIDAEGRAGDVNPARRILGGVAPQRGQEARRRDRDAAVLLRQGLRRGAQGGAQRRLGLAGVV